MNGGLVLALVVLGAVIAFLAYRYHRQQLDEAYASLLRRDGLRPTHRPCGRGPAELALLRACPEGDRRTGVEHGVTGSFELDLGESTVTAECAAFVWWWEEEHTHRDSNGDTTTSYSKQRRTIGMVQVPFRLPTVSIAPEWLLTKWGLGGRGDFQVESEEFNRCFDVRTVDRDLAIRLLDAQFQRFMLELFEERYVEFNADIILVGGDPEATDASLYGDISELPGARGDAQLIASRVPRSFWRALRHADRGLAATEEAGS